MPSMIWVVVVILWQHHDQLRIAFSWMFTSHHKPTKGVVPKTCNGGLVTKSWAWWSMVCVAFTMLTLMILARLINGQDNYEDLKKVVTRDIVVGFGF